MLRLKHNFEMPGIGLQLYLKGWFGNYENGFKYWRMVVYALIVIAIYYSKVYVVMQVIVANQDEYLNIHGYALWDMITFKRSSEEY